MIEPVTLKNLHRRHPCVTRKDAPLHALAPPRATTPAAFAQAPAPARLPLDALKLPPGFAISVYAENVPNARFDGAGPGRHARSSAPGPRATSTRSSTRTATSKADEVITIARGLDMPNGVALRDGALFVAEVPRSSGIDNIEAPLDAPPAPAVVSDALPERPAPRLEVHRASGRTAGCTSRSARRATSASGPTPATRPSCACKPDGSGARGVRAAASATRVGFDWHPVTKELWFTDNGRDMLGDDLPPDELNRAPAPGPALRLPLLPRRHDRRSRNSARSGRARSFTPPARDARGRTSPRSACASTPARCSRPSTGTRSSSPSTARGTAARRSATASCW